MARALGCHLTLYPFCLAFLWRARVRSGGSESGLAFAERRKSHSLHAFPNKDHFRYLETLSLFGAIGAFFSISLHSQEELPRCHHSPGQPPPPQSKSLVICCRHCRRILLPDSTVVINKTFLSFSTVTRRLSSTSPARDLRSTCPPPTSPSPHRIFSQHLRGNLDRIILPTSTTPFSRPISTILYDEFSRQHQSQRTRAAQPAFR